MAYEVRLDVFEGPLDLLLHLITRRRVDIYDVSIATITEEYVAALADLERLDLEVATSFLVVAATLLELKSARLLPARHGDEGDARLLEERDLLLARVVECATYRDAGAWLGAGLLAGEGYFARTAGLEPQFALLAPDLLAGVGPVDVAAAAARVLEPKPQPELDISHLAPIRASVRDAIVDLAGVLRGGMPATFEELCGPRAERIVVVVRFLALLELFKAGAVEIEQAGHFGDIIARWTGDATAADALAEVEAYDVEMEGSA